MTLCKMSEDEMTVGKMARDKMTIDEIYVCR